MSDNVKTFIGWVAGILFFGSMFLFSGSDSSEVQLTPTSASNYSESSTTDTSESYDLDYDSTQEEASSEDSSGCDSGYSGCVPDVSYDLDCADIGESVEVYGDDPHGFDRDGDGWGCDTY